MVKKKQCVNELMLMILVWADMRMLLNEQKSAQHGYHATNNWRHTYTSSVRLQIVNASHTMSAI